MLQEGGVGFRGLCKMGELVPGGLNPKEPEEWGSRVLGIMSC